MDSSPAPSLSPPLTATTTPPSTPPALKATPPAPKATYAPNYTRPRLSDPLQAPGLSASPSRASQACRLSCATTSVYHDFIHFPHPVRLTRCRKGPRRRGCSAWDVDRYVKELMSSKISSHFPHTSVHKMQTVVKGRQTAGKHVLAALVSRDGALSLSR